MSYIEATCVLVAHMPEIGPPVLRGGQHFIKDVIEAHVDIPDLALIKLTWLLKKVRQEQYAFQHRPTPQVGTQHPE